MNEIREYLHKIHFYLGFWSNKSAKPAPCGTNVSITGYLPSVTHVLLSWEAVVIFLGEMTPRFGPFLPLSHVSSSVDA